MPKADLVLTNAHVVTMDDRFQVFPEGALAILDGELVAVGPSQEVLSSYPEAEVVDCGGKALIPGLINAHTHAAMSLLRGMADDRRLDVWLLGYIMPVEREFVTPEFVRLGTSLACAEMIRSGVTCFADMYYFEETVAEAVAEAGMRALCSQTVLKFPTPDAESYEDALQRASEFIRRWRHHPLIVPSVAPHAAYTSTPEILRACTDLAVEFDVPLHIHIAETAQEVQDWRKTYDMPVVPWVKKQGLFEAKVLAAHCVHVDIGEIHTLQHVGAGVSHNPSSNLKLASGFAPVTQMLAEGIHLGIGTDGPASNNDLDMFEELRLASFVAKVRSGDPTAAPARTTLAMATILGAKALHLGHLTGSLEPGKRADLALVDLDTLHSNPHFDHDPESVYSRLVYTAKASDVTDVMVDGRWLMRERELLTVHTDELLPAAAEFAKRIGAFLIEREDSVLSKLVAIGGAEREESYEIQMKMRLPQPDLLRETLAKDRLEIVRHVHYREYDTYFTFADPRQGRLRYREDEFIDDKGEVYNVRSRLTLIGPAAEREYPQSVLLSRSRFIAPANHSERFFREYFTPSGEITVHKDRLRWLVRFHGQEFFINIDRLLQPAVEGHFLEIKSRTWSRGDAEVKAGLILELLKTLGVEGVSEIRDEYPDLVTIAG
ncbi:MAG TPA: amidohydrolase family protein [Anaerolineales bacterium]